MAMNGPVFDGTRVYVSAQIKRRAKTHRLLVWCQCKRCAKVFDIGRVTRQRPKMSKAFTWASSAWGLAPSGCFEQPGGAPHPPIENATFP